MTRLHDAFDVLVDRGDPVGSDILLARARDAVERGGLAEFQPSTSGDRTRLRVVIAAALCVAVVTTIALVSRTGTTPPANPRPVPFDCYGSVGSVRSAHVKLEVERDARAQVSIGAYTFTFAVVFRNGDQLFLAGRIVGPGDAAPPGFSAASGPLVRTGHRGDMTQTANVPGGPLTLTCTR